MMRMLEDEGLLARGHKKRVRASGRLPGVSVIEVTAIDEDGDLVAEPATTGDMADGTSKPIIHLAEGRRGRAPKVGDRVLARLSHIEGQRYEGQVIKILPRAPSKVIGVLEQARIGLVVRPLDRGVGRELPIDRDAVGKAEVGELVLIESKGQGPINRADIVVTDILGHADDASAISLLAAHQHDLPLDFSPEALEEAKDAAPAKLGKRVDLRTMPLVTICLLYTSPSPRDKRQSRMPSSA